MSRSKAVGAWLLALGSRLSGLDCHYFAMLLALTVVVATFATPTAAQTTHPTDEAIAQIQSLRTSLAYSELTHQERVVLLDELLRQQRKLIENYPNDVRQPSWMIDLAGDLLFESMVIQGDLLTALVGIPTQDQVHRVHAFTSEAFELCRRADIGSLNVIAQLEAHSSFKTDVKLQQQRQLLLERERVQRLPLARGIAGILHAEFILTHAGERMSQFEVSRTLLTDLPDVLSATAMANAHLYRGLAEIRLAKHDAARQSLALALEEASVQPHVAFAAQILMIESRASSDGPDTALRSLDSTERDYLDAHSLFYRMLIIDQRHKLLRLKAEALEGEQRLEAIARAYGAYTEVLVPHESSATQRGIPVEALRPMLLDRIARAAARDQASDLPMVARVAIAGARASVAQTRPMAIATLRILLDPRRADSIQQGASGFERPAALFFLGSALLEEGELIEAAEQFLELAQAHSSDVNAERSIEICLTITSQRIEEQPGDARANYLLRTSLALLLERYPNVRTIDHWRYVAAQLAMQDGRHDEARALFESVSPDSSLWLSAQVTRMLAARNAAQSGPARQSSDFETVLHVGEQVQQFIESAANKHGSWQEYESLTGLLAAIRAEALVRLGEHSKAIGVLDSLSVDSLVKPPALGIAVRSLLEAQKALGQSEQSMPRVQQLLAAWPAEALDSLVPLLELLRSPVEELLDINQPQRAQQLAQQTLLPAAQVIEKLLESQPKRSDFVTRNSEPAHVQLAGEIAAAHRLAGSYDHARELYEALLAVHPNAMTYLMGKAECLFHPPHDSSEVALANAMEIYKQIAAMGQEAARSDYWLSQLRMLQILQRTGRNTHQILPRIERLRQQSPTLGGERFRPQFDALAAKLTQELRR